MAWKHPRWSRGLPLWPAEGPAEPHWCYAWSQLTPEQWWVHRPTARQQRLLEMHGRHGRAFQRLQAWDLAHLPAPVGMTIGGASLVSLLASLLLGLGPIGQAILGGVALLGLLAMGGRAYQAHRQARAAPQSHPWRVFWDGDDRGGWPLRPWLGIGLGCAGLGLGLACLAVWALPLPIVRHLIWIPGTVVALILGHQGLYAFIERQGHLSYARMAHHRYHRRRHYADSVRKDLSWAWPCSLPDPVLRARWRARGHADLDAYIDQAAASPVGWTRWDQAALCQALLDGPETLPALAPPDTLWKLADAWAMAASTEEEGPSFQEAWQHWRDEGQRWPALMPLKRVLNAIPSKETWPAWLQADVPWLWALHQRAHDGRGVPRLPGPWAEAPIDARPTPHEVALAWLIESWAAPSGGLAPLLAQLPPCAPDDRSPQELLWRVMTDAQFQRWERLALLEAHAPSWVAPVDYLNAEAWYGTRDQVTARLAQVPPTERHAFLAAWANPRPPEGAPALAEPTLVCLMEGVDLTVWWEEHQAHCAQQLTRDGPTAPAYAALDRMSAYATPAQRAEWVQACPPGVLPRAQAQVRAEALAARPAPLRSSRPRA